MFKRWFLFALTNVAVMVTIGLVTRLTGVDQVFNANGINYRNLIIISGLWGFSGSIISLLLSKTMAKWSIGAKVIEHPQSQNEIWLTQTVRALAEKAGIGMPDVAIYDAPDLNAFATGAFRNSSLVAVSSGLLAAMTKEEVEAVLGHEITHVSNGDMITMALLQGVVNSFVVFVTQILRIVLRSRNSRGGVSSIINFGAEIVAQIALTLLGSLICAYFSRQREFRADAGSAQLRGAGTMIAALSRLGGVTPAALPGRFKAFGISGGVGAFFATHPPLQDRIAALQRLGGR
jgi:heat shock protein HtpX